MHPESACGSLRLLAGMGAHCSTSSTSGVEIGTACNIGPCIFCCYLSIPVSCSCMVLGYQSALPVRLRHCWCVLLISGCCG